ncbi:MAG: LPP20 family lipoprotein [Elusimicrobiota bacterium]
MKKYLLLSSALFFAVACATSQKSKGAPEWISKGAAAFKESGKYVFYGIGIAPATISDESLRREAADNRARADIQKVFSVSIEGSMTNYTANEGERVERVLKTFQSGKMNWVKIVERYQAPDGTVYSLAKIDLEQI